MAKIERKTKRYPTDLTDDEWERIAPLLSIGAGVTAVKLFLISDLARRSAP